MMKELFKERKEKLNFFKSLTKRRPRVTRKKSIPEGVYQSCPECHESILSSELENSLYVCPHCHAHLSISAPERIQYLVDEGSFKELYRKTSIQNPLEFPNYTQKIESLKKKTQLDEAVVIGTAKIQKHPLVLAVMDSRFLMGSMGHVVGEKITQAVEQAIKKRLPLVIFCASGGARMQEGMISLLQMAKTSQAIARLKEKNLLYVSVITHPTTGGVTASFATLGDIILAEPHALMGFAGPRVIEQTINQTLPEGFQRAEFMLQHGHIDLIVERSEMRSVLGQILRLHDKEERSWISRKQN